MKINTYHTLAQAIHLKQDNTTVSSKTLRKLNEKITQVINSSAEMESALRASQCIKNTHVRESITGLLQEIMQINVIYTGKIKEHSDGTRFLDDDDRCCVVLEKLSIPVNREHMKDELKNARATGNRLLHGAMLTENEIESIKWYTSVGYQYINDALRKKENLIDFLKGHKINVLNGMDKIGTHHGTVYRALYVDDITAFEKMLRPGDVVSDRGFLSTTTCMDFAKSFRGGKNTVVYAIQKSFSGYNVSGIAQLDQGEVLHKPGILLRINAIKRTVSNLFIILEGITEFHPGENILDMSSGEKIGIALSNNVTSFF